MSFSGECPGLFSEDVRTVRCRITVSVMAAHLIVVLLENVFLTDPNSVWVRYKSFNRSPLEELSGNVLGVRNF